MVVKIICRMFLQKTFELEDCFFTYLSEETVNRSSLSVLTQEVVQNTQLTLPQKFEMSFKLKSSINGYRTYLTPVTNKSANDPNYALFLQQYSNLMTCGYRTSSTNGLISNRTIDGTIYHDWKVVRDGNSFKYYFDGVEVASTTITWFDDYTPHTVVFNCWGTGSVSMKELKFKAL